MLVLVQFCDVLAFRNLHCRSADVKSSLRPLKLVSASLLAYRSEGTKVKAGTSAQLAISQETSPALRRSVSIFEERECP